MITKDSEVLCRSLAVTSNDPNNPVGTRGKSIRSVLGGGMVFGMMFGLMLAMFGLAYVSSL